MSGEAKGGEHMCKGGHTFFTPNHLYGTYFWRDHFPEHIKFLDLSSKQDKDSTIRQGDLEGRLSNNCFRLWVAPDLKVRVQIICEPSELKKLPPNFCLVG